ncbi:hypothetical protein NMY22_g18311 [Coprinellus aureogranulatus]|nr:hypothetical protein NMY22_g18311 [Coprinellus aureogranulatus]
MASMGAGVLLLPYEILFAICKELPPPSLAVASQLSRTFNVIAERILYASVHIVDVITPESPTPWKTYRWCESVLKRLPIIDAMRTVHIRWPSDGSPPPLPQYFIAFCEHLGESLQYLHYLESLELQLGPANRISPMSREPMHAVERVLRRCRFPRLQVCSIGADYNKGNAQPYTHVLTHFLASHSGLMSLKIPDHHAALNLPIASLHQLSTFRALALNGADTDLMRMLPMMSGAPTPIQTLDLTPISARISLLRNVATFLPTLETLRIRLALRHTLHYAFTGIRILTGLSAVLSDFTQLVWLDLAATELGPGTWGRNDLKEEQDLCLEWNRACPTLRRITFPSGHEYALSHDFWHLVDAQNQGR